jgi:hypothetical protein
LQPEHFKLLIIILLNLHFFNLVRALLSEISIFGWHAFRVLATIYLNLPNPLEGDPKFLERPPLQQTYREEYKFPASWKGLATILEGA